MAYSDKDIIEALHKTRGKIYLAADELGCHYGTIYYHMQKNPEIKKVCDGYRQKMVDRAEKALEECIDERQPWAIALALKTQGKNRGYVERQEVSSTSEVKLYATEATPDDL